MHRRRKDNMKKQFILAIGTCLVMALLSGRASAGEAQADRSTVLSWAKASAVPISTDLSPLGKVLGKATVVALSEGTHGAGEPLEFRNQVLRYLVEKQGFTAIAIESGTVEGQAVQDYVLGGPGSLDNVVSQGFSWTFHRMPQNRALVEWLRQYNADARHKRKVNFYGFDVPGSPGNPNANRGIPTAITAALTYLDRVDAAAAAGFHARLAPLLGNLHLAMFQPADAPTYDQLSGAERNALTGLITDVIALIERREASYIAASTTHDYEAAYRAAIGARQTDSVLRQIPLERRASAEPAQTPDERLKFFASFSDVRDRAQADNLDWIVRQEGAGGKVLVFAHRYHLSAEPVQTDLNSDSQPAQVAGTYLRRRLGDRLLVIGNVIGGGEIACVEVRKTLPLAPPESMDRLASEVGLPRFLLDLRKAPAPVNAWLDEKHRLGFGQRFFEHSIARGFDVLFYIDTITPACLMSAD
jgi:erythromycin esterase